MDTPRWPWNQTTISSILFSFVSETHSALIGLGPDRNLNLRHNSRPPVVYDVLKVQV